MSFTYHCTVRQLFLIFIILPVAMQGQVAFSMATDASILRNFDSKQQFTVFGQSVYIQCHFESNSTFYALVSYHLNGKYNNPLIAEAKQPGIQPQRVGFTNRSEMKLRQVSIGYKHYLRGSYGRENSYNIYGMGGFGLIIGRATNTFSTPIDTTRYSVPNNIAEGVGNFKRLSLDLSAGFEFPVGYELYFYSEVRVHIPTTEYPSNYLVKNDNAPFLGSINVGIRILFNNDD